MNNFFSHTEDVAEPVGFTARATETLTYNVDDVIQFPATISNFGGYYNPASGLFTCPYDGIYMFFSSIRSDDTDIICYIYKETSRLGQIFSLYSSATASNLVITDCSRGERVWVRQDGNNDVIMGTRASTFSGFLLYRS